LGSPWGRPVGSDALLCLVAAAFRPATSIPPLGDQPGVLVCRHLELLDRLLDRQLLVGRIHDPTSLAGVPLRSAQEGTSGLVGRLAICDSAAEKGPAGKPRDLLLFLGLFRRGQITTPGKNTRALPKLGLEKAFRLSDHRWAGKAGGCERPRSPGGVSGGYGTTIETAPFLGERRSDFSPSCWAVTRPPETAAFSLVKDR
jgi:hypothetical protein